MGNHVKSEVEKRRKAAEEELNPKPKGDKTKKRTASPYRPLGEERSGELWYETIMLITEDRIVFHINGPDKPAPGGKHARWRIEKPVTGDPNVDAGAHRGARTTFDEHGRRRAAWDATGRQVFSWKPGRG